MPTGPKNAPATIADLLAIPEPELGACLGVLMGQPANSTEAFTSKGARTISAPLRDQASGKIK